MYPAVACMTAVWLAKAQRMKWEDILVKITWALPSPAVLSPLPVFPGSTNPWYRTGFLAIVLLALITRGGVHGREAISLVMLVCISLSAIMMVYYPFEKPYKDYLSFARQALVAAGNHEITILAPDEVFEGVLPMVSGKYYKEVATPEDIKEAGVYIWPDRGNTILGDLQQHAKVEMLLERQLDHQGHKFARLAYVIPSHIGP